MIKYHYIFGITIKNKYYLIIMISFHWFKQLYGQNKSYTNPLHQKSAQRVTSVLSMWTGHKIHLILINLELDNKKRYVQFSISPFNLNKLLKYKCRQIFAQYVRNSEQGMLQRVTKDNRVKEYSMKNCMRQLQGT